MATYICTYCGWEGERKKRLRGSKMISNILWWVFLIPGPFYSIWRHTGVQKECPNCGLPMLVKLSSDEGYIAQRKFDIELGLAPIKQKETTSDSLTQFGNTQPPAATPRKPVDPEQW